MRIQLGYVRSYYDELDNLSIEFKEPSLTQAEHAVDADINNIIRRFRDTGVVLGPMRKPEFGNFMSEDTYDVVLERIEEARIAFDNISDEDKKKYGNTPQEYYENKMKEAEKTRKDKVKADEKQRLEKEEQAKIEAAKKLLQQNPQTADFVKKEEK